MALQLECPDCGVRAPDLVVTVAEGVPWCDCGQVLVFVETVVLSGPVIPEPPIDHSDPYGRLKWGYGTERVDTAKATLAASGRPVNPDTVYKYLARVY